MFWHVLAPPTRYLACHPLRSERVISNVLNMILVAFGHTFRMPVIVRSPVQALHTASNKRSIVHKDYVETLRSLNAAEYCS